MRTASPSCTPSGRLATDGAPGRTLCETARVFQRDHKNEEIAERIDHLMTAVFLPDDEERLDAVTKHVAPDLVYVTPEAVYEGPQGLSEAFARYRKESSWRTALRRTSPVDAHHGYFRFSWERSERGTVAMQGWSFGSVDERGAICRIVTFEGLVPGQPGGRS